ncbi:hypothetical protein [Streptomyces sp. NPDC021212]|uniref:hypothetical protein n=1 Tax=Streptomyces sp. NPDC021212 TaxID=3365118 RepID=UPI00378BDA45
MAGGDDRQDGQVDAGGVHGLDAARADVFEPGLVVAHGVEGGAFVPFGALETVERVADGDAVPVFLDSDDLHVLVFFRSSGVGAGVTNGRFPR